MKDMDSSFNGVDYLASTKKSTLVMTVVSGGLGVWSLAMSIGFSVRVQNLSFELQYALSPTSVSVTGRW